MRELGLEHISMPEAIARFGIGDKHSIVVAGTHGKTTTSSLIAHLLMDAQLDPSYLVGGALVGYRESFRSGGGNFFAIVKGTSTIRLILIRGQSFVITGRRLPLSPVLSLTMPISLGRLRMSRLLLRNSLKLFLKMVTLSHGPEHRGRQS